MCSGSQEEAHTILGDHELESIATHGRQSNTEELTLLVGGMDITLSPVIQIDSSKL